MSSKAKQAGRRPSCLAILWMFALSLAPVGAASQQSGEPLLEQLEAAFKTEPLSLGMLMQIVLDPGLDGQVQGADVAAARLIVSGRLDRGFHYRLQTNFAASPSLLDARLGWTQSPEFEVWAGRFKTPFSREFLTFAGSIDFVNRARVVSALSPNRQVGVQLGGALDRYVRWSVGGFTGPDSDTPDDPLLGVARLEVQGLEIGQGTLAVAGHVGGGRDGAVAARVFDDDFEGSGQLKGLDARFETERLLLAVELIRGDWNPAFGPDVDASGSYATAGWMIAPERQLLVRWDRYRAFGSGTDDQLVFGYNVWPTTASEIQVNWLMPIDGGSTPQTLLINLQVGF